MGRELLKVLCSQFIDSREFPLGGMKFNQAPYCLHSLDDDTQDLEFLKFPSDKKRYEHGSTP